ncbi:MAG: helicase-related protein, partial [Planctomycetota bacterium]
TPVLLHGDMSTKDIRAHLAKTRAGVAVTVATAALMGEGIDIPGWDVLILASPFAGGPKTLQAVGRVCRAAANKTSATVIDICDPLVPALVNARYARQAALRKGGVI